MCIDTFSKYCATVPIKGKSDSDLALGFVECMNKMGRPSKVRMADGEGAIENYGLFQKYFTKHHLTYIPSRRHPVSAERLIRTLREMLDKLIKSEQPWTQLIYIIVFTSPKTPNGTTLSTCPARSLYMVLLSYQA